MALVKGVLVMEEPAEVRAATKSLLVAVPAKEEEEAAAVASHLMRGLMKEEVAPAEEKSWGLGSQMGALSSERNWRRRLAGAARGSAAGDQLTWAAPCPWRQMVMG